MPERSRPEPSPELDFAEVQEEAMDGRVQQVLSRSRKTLQLSLETRHQLKEIPVELVSAKVQRATTSQLDRLCKKVRDNTKAIATALGILVSAQAGVMAIGSGSLKLARTEQPELEEVERIARDILSLETRIVKKVAPGLTEGLETFRESHPASQPAPEERVSDMPENREELMEEVNTEVLKQARLSLQNGGYPLDGRFEDWREDLYRDAAHLVEQRQGVRLHLQSEDINGINPGVNLYRLVSTHAKNILVSDPRTAVAMVETLDDGGGYVLALRIQDPYLASEMIHRYVTGDGDIKSELDAVLSRPEDLRRVAPVLRPEDRSALLDMFTEDLDGLRSREHTEGSRLRPFIIQLERAIAVLEHVEQ